MSFVFFVVHLVDIDLVRIFPGENVGNLEKAKVEKNFSVPPLEMGSLEPEGLVEIASAVIGLFWCLLHALYLLKIVGEITAECIFNKYRTIPEWLRRGYLAFFKEI
ncbi:hypothetical protein RHGRI_018119 [Rhododendron griersonianum]|uniref:Uncharacterized protein n=1 Tax=Rhododendron griersonianum TaxID=479676 RepID=A0AAV6K0G1_9ERIC|nr:hypothetical protein RHGRI_018119 [Rhododendron griersonianum]